MALYLSLPVFYLYLSLPLCRLHNTHTAGLRVMAALITTQMKRVQPTCGRVLGIKPRIGTRTYRICFSARYRGGRPGHFFPKKGERNWLKAAISRRWILSALCPWFISDAAPYQLPFVPDTAAGTGAMYAKV